MPRTAVLVRGGGSGDEAGEVTVTELTRVTRWQWLLSEDHQMYAHNDGYFIVWSPSKNSQVTIDPIGMTEGEIIRAISAADQVLIRQDPPRNRKQRRARARLH